ncbi:MAG: cytochrome C oxidase subunit IV family protein [Mycobacterium sp.]
MSVRLPEAARSTTVVWVVLSAITVVSWWLGPAHQSGPLAPSTVITVVVLGLGVIKTRLIIRHFMEVRTAPLWLRVATDVWLVALWGGVLAIYLY